MIVKYVTIGTTEVIETTAIGSNGELLNGELVKFSIRRLSDNKFYNFTTSQFISVVDQTVDEDDITQRMTQPSTLYSPGKYSYPMFIDPVTFSVPDSYCFRACSNGAANSPYEGEIKTQYASFDEAIAAMEETEIIPADVDIPERKVERGQPNIIRKKLSDFYWIEMLLWYDHEGGQIIRATSEVIYRETIS